MQNSLRILPASAIPLMIFSCSETEQDNLPEFRNVIVIISDDHAWHSQGSYGNDHIRTSRLDRLASEGTLFTNAYCNSPICSASRQSLLTGKYPQATGVTLLFTPFRETGKQP
jgi:arylsulfatase A-like enzyme